MVRHMFLNEISTMINTQNMKKEIFKITFLLLVLAISFYSCEKNESLLPLVPQKGRLSKIIKYSNSSAATQTGEVVYTYDKEGNMIKEEFFTLAGNPKRFIIERYNKFEYAENKKIKMEIFSGEAGNPTLGSYVEYFYEGKLLIKEEVRNGRGDYGTLIHSINYEYDERGNLIRKYMNDPKEGVISDIKYDYDSQNRLIVQTSDSGYIKYTYDTNGRKIKIEKSTKNGKLLNYTKLFYKGNSKLPQKELNFNEKGTQTRKYQHYYDGWGNLIETVINDECSMFKRKYNGNLIIEEILYWWHEYGYHGTGQMPELAMSRYEYEEL